jgi:hypothetical protein
MVTEVKTYVPETTTVEDDVALWET